MTAKTATAYGSREDRATAFCNLTDRAEITMNNGTIVYHATDHGAVDNIMRSGVRPVAARWGGGELGPGFYTHVNIQGAAGYLHGAGAVIEIEINTAQALRGKGLARNQLWFPAQDPDENRDPKTEALLIGYDYLYINHGGGNVLEYKFNKRCFSKLRPNAVHYQETNGWRRCSYREYLDGVDPIPLDRAG